MINKDKVVPVQRTDLLTLYGTILGINGIEYEILAAEDGEATVSVDEKIYVANQPVKHLEIADGVAETTVWMVADFDFAGVSVDGTPAEIPALKNDAATLYKVDCDHSTVTVTAISPAI